jgi:hypothetical protein
MQNHASRAQLSDLFMDKIISKRLGENGINLAAEVFLNE